MKKLIKIMYIIDSMKFGGAEVLLRDLTRGLVMKQGYKISVCYSTPGPVVDDFLAMGIPIIRLPRSGRFDPFLTLRIWREIRREKPAIVHTHLFKSDFHGRLAARLAGVPVVISTLHNCERWASNPFFGRFYGWTTLLADKIIAVSREVREYAIKYGLSKPERLETIPNAISIEQFNKVKSLGDGIRREFNVSDNAPLIGVVARLSEQKNHSNFLHAAASIIISRPDTRFLIVGDGPLHQPLRELAHSLGLTDSAIFCGTRRDMQAIYSALDLLVFSSRWEGLPVALLEGMAAELAIVATNVGGISGVLKDGVTGYLVEPGNSDELARACLQLIANPEERKKMGLMARAQVQSMYGMDAMVDSTIALYRLLLLKTQVR